MSVNYKILTDFLDKMPSNKKFNRLKMIEAIELNEVRNENCLDTMKLIPDNFVDLTVTSPPYDDLRKYKGFTLPKTEIAKELFRVTKEGGVVVWIVNDKTKNYCESLTSFKTAIMFVEEVGFNLHDTMIYKRTCAFPDVVRYYQDFEYMFVFSKGKPKTFNPLKQLKSKGTLKRHKDKDPSVGGERQTDGSLKKQNDNSHKRKTEANKRDYRIKSNVWEFQRGNMKSTKDKIAFKHPAIFPEQLANDHIISWSNENDIVYDPFMGSGTTAKMAKINNRNWIGSEISKEYCEIIHERLERMSGGLF